MKGKYILLSGTASRDCPEQELDIAIRFVQSFTAEVLKAGGGMVVLLGDENRTKGADGRPRIFDWIILRAVEEYVGATTQAPKFHVRAVMADDAWQSRMDDGNRRTFSNLQQRGVLEVERIRRERFTGGEYRRTECELADALVALGGGKGTYSVGEEMMELGKPVLPLDLKIGALSEDGEGALQLHRELQSNPSDFFPATHGRVINQVESLSLQGGNHQAAGVAQRAVEILSRELHRGPESESRGLRRLFGNAERAVNKFLTIIGVLRAVDFVKQLFGGG